MLPYEVNDIYLHYFLLNTKVPQRLYMINNWSAYYFLEDYKMSLTNLDKLLFKCKLL